MEIYPRGRRGSPAKGVVRETVARVQIPQSPPKKKATKYGGFFAFNDTISCVFDGVGTKREQYIFDTIP